MEASMDTQHEDLGQIGHNSADIPIIIRAKLFNSVKAPDGGPRLRDIAMHAGDTLSDLVNTLGIDRNMLFIVWANGRDVTKRLGAEINLDYVMEDGDEIALSGPIPYSWGYGSPVV
jgi:hypothetical protein